MTDYAVGDRIFCPTEGWSGEITQVLDGNDGCPAALVIRGDDATWITMPVDAYDRVGGKSVLH